MIKLKKKSQLKKHKKQYESIKVNMLSTNSGS
jgi:hypothetical protein